MSHLDYFERRLDSKNRLTVPTELRSQFSGGKVIVTRGFGKYLHMYTEKVWDQIVEPRLTGDVLDERVADLNVQFRLGHQVSHMDDRQGRITLSQSLLDYAGVKKDIVAVRIGTSYWRLMSKKAAGIDSA